MTTSGIVVATLPADAATDASSNPSSASTSTDNLVVWHRPSAPGTTITKHHVKTHVGSARFSFVATGHASGFQCALAKRHARLHFTHCKSPKAYTHRAKGHYRFEVRAIGAGGVDKTPAKRTFTITR
jgi:hypothetical protein